MSKEDFKSEFDNCIRNSPLCAGVGDVLSLQAYYKKLNDLLKLNVISTKK